MQINEACRVDVPTVVASGNRLAARPWPPEWTTKDAHSALWRTGAFDSEPRREVQPSDRIGSSPAVGLLQIEARPQERMRPFLIALRRPASLGHCCRCRI